MAVILLCLLGFQRSLKTYHYKIYQLNELFCTKTTIKWLIVIEISR